MADLLPSSPDPSAGDGRTPRVIGVDSEDADALLAALQSETARDILGVLYDDPATPSDIAGTVDTSVQNVRYHLDRLSTADLIEVVDTVYSEKGREMSVYAPAAKPVVVFAGDREDTEGVEAALSRLLGGLGALALSSLVVQRLFGGPGTGFDVGFGSAGGDSGAEPTGGNRSGEYVVDSEQDGTTAQADDGAATAGTEEATEAEADAATTAEAGTRTEAETAPESTLVEEATETARTLAEETTRAASTAEAGGAAAAGAPPGLVFFAGGVVVLLALAAAWYLRRR